MGKKLKRIKFHNSFEEQRLYGQSHAIHSTVEQRIAEMHRLNTKLYGENYGSRVSKKIEIYIGLPGESVEDFYKRINKEE